MTARMMHRIDQVLPCPNLIGREESLARLSHSVEELETGRGRTLFIAGEAGIGKTRLVTTFRSRFSDHFPDGLILEGHAFDMDRSLPYAPVNDLLRSVIEGQRSDWMLELLSRYGGELVKLVPEIRDIVHGTEATPALDAEQEHRRLIHSLSRFLTDIATDRPILVVFEDLHWSDDTSLEFLFHLSRRIGDYPVLLLLTLRAEEMHPSLSHLLARFERERLATGITLEPLALDEVDAMLEAMLGGRSPLHLDLRDAIWALTEGNPFFIEEVIRSVALRSALREDVRQWGAAGPADLQIPHSVQDAVQRRLEMLSPAAHRLALVAATAGRRFEFPLLEAVTGFTEEAVLDAIRELMAAGLVVEESVDRFAFRHALTREAIYSRLLKRERRSLHRAIAVALPKLQLEPTDARLAEVANHAYEAGMWTEALDYSRQMGEQAQMFNDPRAAVEHYSRGLIAARELGVDPPHQLYLARGLAFAASGKFEEALADQNAALQAARSDGDRHAEWQALLNLGMLWSERDYTRTGDYYQQASDLVQSAPDEAMRATSLNALGNWRLNIEQPERALSCHREALRIFRSECDRKGIAETLDLLGMANYLSGDLISGTRAYREAQSLFEAVGNQAGLASCLATLTMRGATLQTNTMVVPDGTLDDCIVDGREALEIARSIGWRAGEAYALWMLGFALGARGDAGQALAAAVDALETAAEIEHRQWMTAAHCTLGAILLDALNLDEARSHFQRALQLASEINSRHWLRAATGFLGSTHIEKGNHRKARAVLETIADDDLPKQTLSQRLVWCARSELLLAEGQPEHALAILDELRAGSPHARERPVLRLSLLRGRALAALGRTQDSMQPLEDGLSLARRQRAKGMEWRIRLELARSLIEQGESLAADEHLEASNEVASAIASSLEGERRATRFNEQFARRVPRPVARTSLQQAKWQYDGLTARQREVAVLVAQGESNRSIAELLSIGERTVESHITSILSTLAFSSRTQIAVWAVEKGLLADRENGSHS